MTGQKAIFDRATLAFVGLALLILALRIWGLVATPLNLQADEAQYWSWSRHLDFGYFSKPPLIAWVVAGTTSLFGDAEWAVRLTAPVAHTLAALALFGLGRSAYGATVGVWAGLSWLLLPGVFLSAGVMSTDALVLPLWSIALFCAWRLVVSRSWAWPIALGLVLGLGVLAKYAMLYFVLCAALAAYWSIPVRDALKGGRWAAVVGVGLLVMSPNLYWNVTHHFETVGHTVSNAHLTHNLIHPEEVFEFIGSQAAVIGPVLFCALGWMLWRAWMRSAGLSDQDRFLIAFILPPILLMIVQAFLSRANGNWAAVAYPAAIVWIAGTLAASKRGRAVLIAATLVNFAMGAVFGFAALRPDLADRVKSLSNSIKRARGWDETAHQIALRATPHPGEPPYTAVLVDDRDLFYELNYYWREARREGAPLPPVRMWKLYSGPHNSAESNDPMRPEEGARVLIVHQNARYVPLVAADFTVFRAVEPLSVSQGAVHPRVFEVSVGEGFAPAPRDAAFMQRIHGIDTGSD
ncbi:MAG TPA: glycosyltransferase family 39 protein [Caulobacterales bacterium]|nr:glycosyltransferase family 39 protein [Caulobacterales bacterium]